MEQMPVKFEDVEIHQATILPKKGERVVGSLGPHSEVGKDWWKERAQGSRKGGEDVMLLVS